jgi:hypothetical protein
MYKYCLLITFGDNGVIKHAYSPDLKHAFNVIDQELSTTNLLGLTKSLQQQILDKLNDNKYARVPFQEPRTQSDYRYISIDNNQHWTQVFVSYKPKKGVFATALPIIGHGANVVALISGALVSLAAIAITIGKDKDAAIPLGVSGAILSILVMGMLYIFSDATRMLRNTGHFLDNLTSKKSSTADTLLGAEEGRNLVANAGNEFDGNSDSDHEVDPREFTRQLDNKFERHGYSTKAIITGIGASGLVLANAVVTNIKAYQETHLLGEKYQEQYPSTPTWSIDTVVWSFLIGANIANLAFQLSFGMRATEMVEARQQARIIDSGFIEEIAEDGEAGIKSSCC